MLFHRNKAMTPTPQVYAMSAETPVTAMEAASLSLAPSEGAMAPRGYYYGWVNGVFGGMGVCPCNNACGCGTTGGPSTYSVDLGIGGEVIVHGDTEAYLWTPYALQFTGASSMYLTADDAGLPSSTSDRTIAFWLKMTSSGYNPILHYGTDPSSSVFVFANYGLMIMSVGGVSSLVSTGTVNDGDWHYILLRCSSGTWDVYVDNVVDTSSRPDVSDTDTTLGGTLRVGREVAATFGSFTMDDLRVYGSALDSTERSDLWNSGDGVTNDPVGGVVRWYKFNEGDGTTAADDGSNNEDGTLVNGPAWVTGKV